MRRVLTDAAVVHPVDRRYSRREVSFARLVAQLDPDADKRGREFERLCRWYPSREKKTLALKPKRKSEERKIVKALKRGKKASAKLAVKLTDELGNSSLTKLRVKLKR